MLNANTDPLEHLFTREIDGAASRDERELLHTLLQDPDVRARFQAYAALDEALGAALRADFDRAAASARSRRYPRRLGRALALGAAACVATLIWLVPPPPKTPASGGPQQAGAPSWFAPLEPPGDTVEALPADFERPRVRFRGTQRYWIVVPQDEPGHFLIVEMDRVRTAVIGLHEDF